MSDTFRLWQSILQIEILKSCVAERLIVIAGELHFHKSPLILERRVIGINTALGFHDNGLVNFTIFALENEEVRRVHSNISPATVQALIALDLKFCHGTVAVVVDLQAKPLNLIEGQDFFEESLLKAAVCVIGQIVEGAVFLRMGRILLAKHLQNGGISGFLCQLHHGLLFCADFQLTFIIQNDAFYQVLCGVVIVRFLCVDCGSEICDIQQAGFLGNQLFLCVEGTLFAERLSDICFHHSMVVAGTVVTNAVALVGHGQIDLPQQIAVAA